jgi:2-polyprenyl-3-methyl-5-hydroxy-6-metoxy-1,4-benzoquinol methylase
MMSHAELSCLNKYGGTNDIMDTNMNKASDNTVRVEPDAEYADYREWKKWQHLFQPTTAEAAMFDREFSDLQVTGRQLLDIGFGSGALIGWALTKGARVFGVEVQHELVAEASRKQIPAWTSLDDIADHQFDIIVAFDVLEHLEPSDIAAFFRSIKMLLKQDGTFVVRTPNCQSAFGLINHFGDSTHKTMLSAPLLAHYGKEAGLTLVKAANAVDQRSFEGKLTAPLRQALQWITLRMLETTWGSKGTPGAAEVIVHFKHNKPRS